MCMYLILQAQKAESTSRGSAEGIARQCFRLPAAILERMSFPCVVVKKEGRKYYIQGVPRVLGVSHQRLPHLNPHPPEWGSVWVSPVLGSGKTNWTGMELTSETVGRYVETIVFFLMYACHSECGAANL
jgi:hypothetical protein